MAEAGHDSWRIASALAACGLHRTRVGVWDRSGCWSSSCSRTPVPVTQQVADEQPVGLQGREQRGILAGQAGGVQVRGANLEELEAVTKENVSKWTDQAVM